MIAINRLGGRGVTPAAGAETALSGAANAVPEAVNLSMLVKVRGLLQ